MTSFEILDLEFESARAKQPSAYIDSRFPMIEIDCIERFFETTWELVVHNAPKALEYEEQVSASSKSFA